MARNEVFRSSITRIATRGALLAMVLAVLVGFTSTAASASTGSWISIDVPFAFTVGKSTLPAGNYIVTQREGSLVQIQGADGNVLFLVSANSDDKRGGRATVVFHRYGDRYFLAGLRTSDGARLTRPSRTADEERLVMSGARPNVVTIARMAK